jgi:glycosyltransferase involved in cell wall biosynthesis
MLPRISVVTCSYNQGKFIGRTLDSVLAQNYPNLEHIVVDGMSSDDTTTVLARYPHLQVIREPDNGQAEAINKGFRRATGEIFCFLNSDDILYPGTLHRVAAEIDPARARHIVMGRCLFIDENDGTKGVEHPSDYRGLEQVLRVWEVHCIPQPATFWTREVWENCGPMDEDEQLVLDYDLMCRFARRYHFHRVDQLFAGYRLHNISKSCSNDAKKIYDAAIAVSRRYWGTPLLPRFWRLALSLAHFRYYQQTGRAAQAGAEVIRAEQAWVQHRRKESIWRLVRGAWLDPVAALNRWALLNVGQPLSRLWSRVPCAFRTWEGRPIPGRTTAWRHYTATHADGFVGPHFATDVQLLSEQNHIRVVGHPAVPWVRGSFDLEVRLDGQHVLRKRWNYQDQFTLSIPTNGLSIGSHRLEILSSAFVIPSDVLGGEDYRPLSFRLAELRVVEDVAGGCEGRLVREVA